MSVPPNYFITGVWKDDKGVITHVLLHTNGADGFGSGKKVTEADAIALLVKESIMTLRWNYTTTSWVRGAYCIAVKVGTKTFLRTKPDAAVTDNLDNMIKMNNIISCMP